jgi:Tol biopolymer transport system component
MRLSRFRFLAVLLTLAGAVQAQPAASVDSSVLHPEMFGPGVFSTGAWDFFVAFTPDGNTAYVNRANGSFSHFTIVETRLVGRAWSPPRIATFSGKWSDADPHLSPDGSKLFFISNRPLPGDTGVAAATARDDYDIWFIARGAAGEWGQPQHVGAPVTESGFTEWSPSVAATGNLYFGSARKGGRGGNDLYLARWTGAAYEEPVNLGDSINTRGGEIEPWIAPDESYLIFSGANRGDGPGGYDLYISRRINGTWERARALPAGVNTSAYEYNQSVSPDGRWLYFSSTRSVFETVPLKPLSYAELEKRLSSPGNGLGDIYRIEMAKILPKE